MRVETVQIAWHVREDGKNDPMLSADFWGRELLATGGADSEVKLWNVQVVDGKLQVTFALGLARHEKTVNVVRFSPDGNTLASAGDDRVILLWRPEPSRVSHWGQVKDERDLQITRLTGHSADVYDLAWSPDSQYLVSGSIDHSTLLWHAAKGDLIRTMRDHSHYVQGVAWDPLNRFVVSQSCDRSCRVYSLTHRSQPGHAEAAAAAAQLREDEAAGRQRTTTRIAGAVCKHVIARRAYQQHGGAQADVAKDGSASDAGAGSTERQQQQQQQQADGKDAGPARSGSGGARPPPKQHKMYLDETVTSFFRRPAFSPDGALLLTPTGLFRDGPSAEGQPTTYAFARDDFTRPALHLPGPKQPTVGVRFAPTLFALTPPASGEGPPTALLQLPYRSLFAVSSLDGVYVYDTQRAYPIAAAEHLHYTAITDLAWNAEASLLAVTSSDGYCTFLSFDAGELGQPLPLEEYPMSMRTRLVPGSAASAKMPPPAPAAAVAPAAASVPAPAPAAPADSGATT